MEKKGILERLDQGEIIIGDGGYLLLLEKRGYVKAGVYTPEASIEHPEAVRQLHREFLRAGSDVLLAFTFYASEDKLDNRGHDAGQKFGFTAINKAACQLAREVANEGDALVAGGLSQTPSYMNDLGHDECVKLFKKQVDVFVENGVDFLIGELFDHVEEAEWAVEAMKTSGKPVAICMCINTNGDLHGVSTGDCAVRLAKAGADIIGVNCLFDPDITLQTIRKMKEGLEAAGLKRHLITQPLGFHTPDVTRQGFTSCPEFPLALEPRILTRWDCHKYARAAYDLGVRFISGCCGFEPYHIRALAEELAEERGRYPKASDKHGLWGEGLRQHTKPWVRARAGREYWENLKPASGRPYCPAMSKPFSLDVPAGHEALKQTKNITDE